MADREVSQAKLPDTGAYAVRGLLGLRGVLERTERVQYDWTAFFDFSLILCFFLFLQSDFVFLPGESIALPSAESSEYHQVDAVLSVVGSLYIFQNRILDERALESALVHYVRDQAVQGRPSLLLKVDRAVPVDQLLALASRARSAGFAQIVIANEISSAGGQAVGP